KSISIALYEKEKTFLKNYDLEGKLINKTVLNDVPFVLEMCYHPTQSLIAFSVIRNGQSDLMLYNYKTQVVEDLSNDMYDDLSPRFSIDGQYIYFISNQLEKSTSTSNYYAI